MRSRPGVSLIEVERLLLCCVLLFFYFFLVGVRELTFQQRPARFRGDLRNVPTTHQQPEATALPAFPTFPVFPAQITVLVQMESNIFVTLITKTFISSRFQTLEAVLMSPLSHTFTYRHSRLASFTVIDRTECHGAPPTVRARPWAAVGSPRFELTIS